MSANRIGIIGAGAAGMSAAYDLLKAGHSVTIFEGGSRVGGLAAGFRDEGWDWELEKFYHHWFQSDADILGLIDELGWTDKVLFPRPKTSMWSKGKAYLFDNPLSMLLFPNLPLIPKIRFGLVGLYLRLTNNWQPMERYTAEAWLIKYMGQTAYEALWRPMLIGKFGDLYRDVTMAWFWARIHTRTVKLGTFEGGFQRFLDMFAERLQHMGATLCLNTPVQNIRGDGNTLKITAGEQTSDFDVVINTTSPAAMLKLAPDLSSAYADQLRSLKNMGAVVVVLALKHQLLTDNTYWLNLPANSPDKSKSEFPFLALVEHTNYMDRRHYGGDHLVYCGDYVPMDHEYFKLSDDALAERFIEALRTFNPAFTPDWIRKRWVFRAPYAQPIPFVNHSRNIPDTRTPIPGLYFASMSQIYPWDRGTNYAVGLGRRVAAQVLADSPR
ncbi:MAG: NAD(P)/FAD-dependent oxidoreductase [Anaerolineae bacterium]|nr:NAD(P)/FAD-dependent oxidoreductase [Anaerolineae bacterium]